MVKKICFLIPSVASGGIQMYLLRFLQFAGNTENITVVVRNKNREDDLLKLYEEAGVKLYFQPLGYVNPVKMLWFYRFFKTEAFDVVCDFNGNFAGMSVFLAYMAKIKKRIAFYRLGKDHFEPSFVKNMINIFMNRLVFKYSTNILLNSLAAISHFFPYRTKSDTRFQVVYNGINIDIYSEKIDKKSLKKALNLPPDIFLIGHVGRLNSAKNHLTILKAIQHLIDKKIYVHLVLCGSETEKLQGTVQDFGIEKYVSILGYRNDVSNLLKVFDCFVFPSITEGQPNALIEAIASGLPIVASNIEPIKECVPKNNWSFLIQATDHIALSEKIASLMDDSCIYHYDEAIEYVYKNFNARTNFGIFKQILYE